MYNKLTRFLDGPRAYFCAWLFVIAGFIILISAAFCTDYGSIRDYYNELQIEIEHNEIDARDRNYFYDPEPTIRTNCAPTRETFVSCVSYMIREENRFINQYRDRIISIEVAQSAGAIVNIYDIWWLESMHRKYKTETIEELLLKLGPIPVEMALAQSILESGWGTSYAARVGNGLFGQIQTIGSHDVEVPWKPGKDMPQPFKSHRDSVTAYFMNLNTHPAYAGFRIARQKSNDPLILIQHMTRYSVLQNEYIKKVSGIIKTIKDIEYDLRK